MSARSAATSARWASQLRTGTERATTKSASAMSRMRARPVSEPPGPAAKARVPERAGDSPGEAGGTRR